ncbi:MAG: PIG-L family deacetylase [Candidatus Acidiferrum sp.]
MNRFTSLFSLLLLSFATQFFFIPRAAAQFPPAPGTGPGLAETIEAIDSARVTTRILYITAHPDDESAATLTYLARGLHADVALLSLTRGEGGQNVLGPEQAPQLGLIRSQELLAATRGYGVKLYFTRAKDFGYSKTPEETMKVWGDTVLRDMVEVIRAFRPNIVINNFGGVHSGHGHHQAAGLLTPKAVQLAADKSFVIDPPCDDCLEKATWGSPSRPVVILDLDRGENAQSGYLLPLDDVSPLWGKTWRDLGLDAFVNHRSQGISAFINSSFLRRPISLKPENESKFDPELLAQPLLTLSPLAGLEGCGATNISLEKLKAVDESLERARAQALTLQWPDATATMASAAQLFSAIYPIDSKTASCSALTMTEEFATVKARIERALRLVAGLSLTVSAARNNLTLETPFEISISGHCRKGVRCELGNSTIRPAGIVEKQRQTGEGGTAVFSVTLKRPPSKIPEDEIFSDQGVLRASVVLTVSGYRFTVEEPATFIAATSTRAERVPLRIVPEFSVSVDPKYRLQLLPSKQEPMAILLRVHCSAAQVAKAAVGVDVPSGWVADAPVDLSFEGGNDRYVKLAVRPPAHLAPGNYTIKAYVRRGEEKFSSSLDPLPSLPTQLWEEPSQVVVHAFEIKVPENLRVGYITAESEPVPEAIEQLGIQVEMLRPTTLAFSDLSRFDAIVVGVRAYELRSDLPGANQRLLDYARNGGTLLVQYQRDFAWDKFQYAPYPAKIDPAKPGAPLPRITDENSPVKFLKPDDPLLNTPNKITPVDFHGWVQERGLYFWSHFDEKYTPLLAMNDPGEPDLNGALVYTHLGKGTYIYAGIAFFRQLPEGVPGAYRLFVNLLSASKKISLE